MNLVVDIGNTLTKVAFFNDSKFISEQSFEVDEDAIKYAIGKGISNVILASVKSNTRVWMDLFSKSNVNVIEFSSETNIPINNDYNSPHTLGMDRLAAIVGATQILPNKDILSIDCGTCITYDYLVANSYQGGAISPGVKIKFQALHNFTDGLPLVSKGSEKIELIGKNTISSIESGVINGTICEINRAIEEYKKINNNLATILSGGDSFWLKNDIKNVDIIEPRLVLIGLNEILLYNT